MDEAQKMADEYLEAEADADFARLMSDHKRVCAERDQLRQLSRKYFRWAYALMIELAKDELQKANGARASENDWPAGQSWGDMVGSSHSIFFNKARDRAGIHHDEFLHPIRNNEIDVGDLYEQAISRPR